MKMFLTAMTLATLAFAGAAAAKGKACVEKPLHLERDGRILEIIRITTGADGLSHGKREKIDGSVTTYLGLELTQFGLGDPSNVVIVSAPPGLDIAVHRAPYREIFMILSGESTLKLSDGTSFVLKPGTLNLMEDTTGAGHGGNSGPCGYVALDLQFKDQH